MSEKKRWPCTSCDGTGLRNVWSAEAYELCPDCLGKKLCPACGRKIYGPWFCSCGYDVQAELRDALNELRQKDQR